MAFDAEEVRKQFPILNTRLYGRRLVYLDNAATTQISQRTMEELLRQYREHEANVHRGIHTLSRRSTARLEKARETVAGFIGAESTEEIIFTSGTTDSINLAAQSFAETFLRPGDEIVTTVMEHHSNLIPWQEACRRTGAVCRVIPVDAGGELDADVFSSALSNKTRLVAVCAVSNVLGTVNPIRKIIRDAHAVGARVLIDGAQAMRGYRTDVRELDCDFLAFSGHKLTGPTGTGVLYGKRELLERLKPVRFGGGMVDTVWEDRATFGELPFRFEAGTPNIAGIIALGCAIKQLEEYRGEAAAYEKSVLAYAERRLMDLPGIRILGSPEKRAGAISFTLEGAHPYDVAALLDKLGIAVRSGHLCAQPLLRAMGLESAVRVSPAFYNTFEEIDVLIEGLERVQGVLKAGGQF